MKTLALIAALCAGSLAAQTYTRADSLRGGLRPERTDFDVTYYHLTVDIDPGNKYIKGTVDMVFKPVVEKPTARIQLDLFKNMSVDKIYDANGKPLEFEREENAVWVKRPEERMTDGGYHFTVEYSGNPLAAKRAPWDGGFDWKKDQNGNPWVGVAVEGTGASLWWPNKDHLSDEPDSMRISLIVPANLVGVSNGNLESEEVMNDKRRFNWKVSYPINNYNVTACVGDYVHFSDVYQGVEGPFDLDYYVLSYNLDKAKKQFQQVKPMFDCYEKYIGPYPFPRDGFALVETPYLGMEHQSAIAYGNKYQNGYLGFDQSGLRLPFDYIIIHETGHEYWGNNVSMKDLADMWIHEGFCTYSEALYVECIWGRDTAERYINAWKKNVSNDRPIISDYHVNKEGSGDMYYKGALMLHTLRHQVNDDEKWLSLIKNIQRDFRLKTTDSKEMMAYMNQALGADYSAVYQTYLQQSKPPKLVYQLRKKGSKTLLTARFEDCAPQFKLDIPVEIGAGKTVLFSVGANESELKINDITPDQVKIVDTTAYFVPIKVK